MKVNNKNKFIRDDTPILTIGYATHNRKDYIKKRLNSLIAMGIPNNIEIIVVDNASTDGTYSAISDLCSGTKIKTYRNDENLGFAGNFVEVLRKAKGDYVVWTSDEDEINFIGVQSLFDWMGDKRIDSVVLNHYRKEALKKLTPLRTNKTRLIRPEDLWGCCHLPGIVWHRLIVLENLNDWEKQKETYPQLSRYYPNLMLLIKIMPNLRSYYFDGYITYQKDYVKSQHVAKKGYQYFHLIPRWLQHNELISFIDLSIQEAENKGHKEYLEKIIWSLNRNIYDFISTAIREERPHLYYYFSRACSPCYIIRRNYKLLKLVIKYFLYSPSLAIRSIRKRLKIKYEI